MDKKNLFNLLDNAYSPYSKVKVSAIAIMKDGTSFNGVNVENSSFGATNCAERSAMFTAVSNGYKAGDFKEIHIASNMEKHLYPCSICRQVMTEFFEPTTKVFMHSKNSEVVIEETLESLVPNAITKGSFG